MKSTNYSNVSTKNSSIINKMRKPKQPKNDK